ncbi:MAG TPA: ATP-binding protein [Tepidisphaeraceae bacterium]|nr:ATP-binding protein [Tepidisphaeraceae bacterium]
MGVAGPNRRGDGSRRRAAGGPAGPGKGATPAKNSRADRNGSGKRGAGGDDVIRATISSDYSAGRDVQQRILDDVERHGYSSDSTFAIRIALEEAMVNAIKHGNGQDPSKKVHVEARVTPRRAEITIEDEGPGFDRAGIPDPTDEANLHKCSGRGILLIEAYMDGVEWSHGGRRLRMYKENA